MCHSCKFGVWGLVRGLGFWVLDLGFRVWVLSLGTYNINYCAILHAFLFVPFSRVVFNYCIMNVVQSD